MNGELFIKEYVPEEEIPSIEYEDSPWEYGFYDPELQMIFHVFVEPDWIRLEDEKTYEFTLETYNDVDGYNYRVWKRLSENKVIIAEWYNDKWYTVDERYIGSGDKRNVDDVIKEWTLK